METTVGVGKVAKVGQVEQAKPLKLAEIKSIEKNRLSTGMEEFDRVLGGGIVSGSVILLSGDPGIGKSTILLQVTESLSSLRGVSTTKQSSRKNIEIAASVVSLLPRNDVILYICGEESPSQIKLRSQRMGIKGQALLLLAETDVDIICTQIEQIKPSLVIIDSIQTLETSDLTGAAGSVGQVRECSSRLTVLAKRLGIPVFLIGHVTKEGSIAGPMVLEHLVDTVLLLEGEKFYSGRTLRSLKNRFGPTDEVGIFEMAEEGFKEVTNPSALFLGEREKNVPGSVVVPILEGTRPILVEIQALTTKTNLAFPRRIASGFDTARLNILSAVIAKRLGLALYDHDIMVNIPGGLKIKDPGADLGVALAIVSSFKNKPVPEKSFSFGEVGLLGEIRKVVGEEKRIKEAKRLGFTLDLSPKTFQSLAIISSKIF